MADDDRRGTLRNPLSQEEARQRLQHIVATPRFENIDDLVAQAGVDFKYDLRTPGICIECGVVDWHCTGDEQVEQCPACQKHSVITAFNLAYMADL